MGGCGTKSSAHKVMPKDPSSDHQGGSASSSARPDPAADAYRATDQVIPSHVVAEKEKEVPQPVAPPGQPVHSAGQDKDKFGNSPKPSEPENEPPNSGGGTWARSEKKNERIRRQRGNSMQQNKPSKEDKEHFEARAKPDVSPENRRFILKVLQKHFLFAALEDEERASVVDYMHQQKCKSGEIVFEQGGQGDCCYIIQSGAFTVSIDDKNLKQLRSKHTFGELAMLYNVKRTATVTCSQEGTLWKMDGSSFRLWMDKLSSYHEKRAMSFLNTDPSFSNMKEEEKKILASACSVQVFGKGEQILREGEVGEWIFIVIEGTVQVFDRYGNSAKKKAGTILGSAGLMYTKQQVSGAKAIDNVACLALGRSSVERLIGSVEDVLHKSAIKALLIDNVSKGSDLSFFKQLTDKQQNTVIDCFEEISINAGDMLVSPGSRAQMVMLIEGEVAVMDSKKSAEDLAGQPLEKLKEMKKEVLTSGMTYGGKNLMNNAEMKVGLVAMSSARVHRVGHDLVVERLKAPFAEVIKQNEIMKVLSDIFLFKNLTEQQIHLTVQSLERKGYSAGDTIVQQGDEAEKFYLIQAGTVRVVMDGIKVRNLGKWDYFGERALLLKEKRSATCVAEDNCVCLVLDSNVFTNIVGIFRNELEQRMNMQDLNLTMSDLRVKAIVGRGSFGTVKLVYHKNDQNKVYALKCVGKKQVVRQGQQTSMKIEREINAQCYHPCIMQFIKTFQDSKNVYFLTEFLGGGDLFYAIREIGNLSKSQSQFYSGSIACALEYLHARSILYRDLKPENVLLDFKGNAKLVDFGCCKIALRTNTLVGTPEYFAPETILGKGYTLAIDWWALGVMLHEFIVGPLPFGRETEDQLELFREILEAPLSFPNYITDDSAISIVNGLLERTPELRIGASTRGAKELKEHAYYTKFDWDALAGRALKPPWTPNQRKLQANWEMCQGEQAEEGEGVVDGTKQEAGMEWAQGF